LQRRKGEGPEKWSPEGKQTIEMRRKITMKKKKQTKGFEG
jgi:hypothetical protein